MSAHRIAIFDPIPDGDFLIQEVDGTLTLKGIRASSLTIHEVTDYQEAVPDGRA